MPVTQGFKFPKPEAKQYDPLPQGLYQCAVHDIEVKNAPGFDGQLQDQVTFKFIALEEGESYGRYLFQTCSLKMVGGQKTSNLYTLLKNLTGKLYSKEECMSSDEWLTPEFFNAFIGKQYTLVVSQKAKAQGGVKNVIDSIVPVKEQLPAYDESKVAPF
jgi:hypothetical protein